jgi:hypothetical protein
MRAMRATLPITAPTITLAQMALPSIVGASVVVCGGGDSVLAVVLVLFVGAEVDAVEASDELLGDKKY